MTPSDLVPSRRPVGGSPDKLPRRSFAKLLAVHAASALEMRSLEEAGARRYPPQAARQLAEAAGLVTRAATGITDTPGASALIQQVIEDFAGALAPLSAFIALRGMGPSYSVTGWQTIPARLPSVAGNGSAWIGEAGVFPVTQPRIGTARLRPRKVGAICPVSNELLATTPAHFERTLQSLVLADLSEMVDGSLTDDQPASEQRPGGLLAGVVPVASTDAGADIAALAGAAAAGKWVSPALIISPERLASLWGDPAWSAQLGAKRLGPFTLAATHYLHDPQVLIGLDADAFASAMDTPDISAGKHTVLTMANADGNAPTQAITLAGAIGRPNEVLPDSGIHVLGGPTGAGTVGAVGSSLFQQGAIALRVAVGVDWGLTRPNSVASISGASW